MTTSFPGPFPARKGPGNEVGVMVLGGFLLGKACKTYFKHLTTESPAIVLHTQSWISI